MNKSNNAPTFTKEQFLNAKEPIGNVDALYAILEDGKEYTKEEVLKLYDDFMNREVK
ncbi:hypothetical protein ACQRC6_01075 [Peptoniphilus sp. SGI.035]|uniref:hypothetical protein n=1 Tax=Peptoniphilus sp. SGI.035 TaxID=3420564 RepID=UPI003CFD9FE0